MADIDQLNSDLAEISTEVDAALQHATDLQTELTALQNAQQSGQTIDLTSALQLAESIKSRLENAGDVAATSSSSSDSSTAGIGGDSIGDTGVSASDQAVGTDQPAGTGDAGSAQVDPNAQSSI